MSRNVKKTIDYLDLKIKIPKNLTKQFQGWLKQFEDHHDFIVTYPKLKNEILKINSTDIIPFLGYIDPSQLTELEQKRLERDISDQMGQYINKTTSSEYKSHYQWCLAALKNFPWGRHFENGLNAKVGR